MEKYLDPRLAVSEAHHASGRPLMPAWKKNLVLVWLSQFFGLTGFWFAMPFIPYYVQALGATEAGERNMWVTIYSVAGYASVAIFSPIWGSAADRYGRKIMLLRANFCNAAIIPFMGIVPSLGVLIFLRFLMGVFSGSTTASQTLIATGTPPAQRGFAIGLLSSAIYCGTLAGCFLGGVVVDALGYRASFLISGLMFFLAGVIVLVGVKENFQKPAVATVRKRSPKRFMGIDLRPVRLVGLLLFLILLMATARQFDAPFLPLLVQDINGSMTGAATWTGVISGIASLAGLLAGPLLGWLADKISAPRVAFFSAVLAGISMIPQGLAQTMGTLVGARFMMIFFAGGLDPVFQIWLAKSTPDKIRGVVFGWALTAQCVGWILAASLSGVIATFIGLRWIYAGGCFMFFLLVPFIAYASGTLMATQPHRRSKGKRRDRQARSRRTYRREGDD